MNAVKRCQEIGGDLRPCRRDSYETCQVCQAELCEQCTKRLAIHAHDATWPVCSKPSCRRLLAIREHYGELVAGARI